MVIYLILISIISIAIGYIQYFYKVNSVKKLDYVLFVLKTSSLFLLFLLLYNISFNKSIYIDEKPELNLLVDNSKSTQFLKQDTLVSKFLNSLTADNEINNKFKINVIPFDNGLSLENQLSFKGNQTNIFKALNQTEDLYKNKNQAIVLLTDGNQTFGQDYSFYQSNASIYPVVFGDTSIYSDVRISSVNVNKFSYLGNQFPVEIRLNYDGITEQNLLFTLYNSNNVLLKKNISFSKENSSATISTNIIANKKGLQFYTAKINTISNEKNVKNNKKEFVVEVLNEHSKVAIISSILHPDLGALKRAIETNPQRKVTIYNKALDTFSLDDYQLIIAYQPNDSFSELFQQLKKSKKSILIISGTKTDWDFINSLNLGITKNAINETELYYPLYNESSLSFIQSDIGFTNFPALEDKFGEISVSKKTDNIINQSINGIVTQQPLVSIVSNNNQKSGFILGEGIWKWRAASLRLNNNFEDFDDFIGKIVQVLSSKIKRDRLEVELKDNLLSNETLKAKAYYRDENYEFDSRANLILELRNKETNETKTYPFLKNEGAYELELNNLTSGYYIYKVTVAGQNLQKKGTVRINEFSIEEQFLTANKSNLKQLAAKNKGILFHNSEFEKLKDYFINNDDFYATQIEQKKDVFLIDWEWILFLIVFLLSLEWFIRKYYGRI